MTESVHDADAEDPSITCELMLIDGEWGITSSNQTTAEQVAQRHGLQARTATPVRAIHALGLSCIDKVVGSS